MLIKNSIHTICFGACVRLKCHEMEGGWVWYGIVVLEVYPTPHSIEVKTCFSLSLNSSSVYTTISDNMSQYVINNM